MWFDTEALVDLPTEPDPPQVAVGIEDSDLHRHVVFVLRADGYVVMPFRRRSALIGHLRRTASWTARTRPPDLLVVDDDGEDIFAEQLVETLVRDDLPVPCIVLSRQETDDWQTNHHISGPAIVFERPFDIDDVRTAVANLVPAGGPW